MAKVIQEKVEMTCTLTLTEKETRMLGWLSGYGADAISTAIFDSITTQYPKEDWRTLWKDLRPELESAAARMNNTRDVFSGRKVAKEPVPNA